eukprot:3352436-Pleurochrysis_carterae.AAC.1
MRDLSYAVAQGRCPPRAADAVVRPDGSAMHIPLARPREGARKKRALESCMYAWQRTSRRSVFLPSNSASSDTATRVDANWE